MGTFELAALLVTMAALLAYVNRRFLGLPSSIGLMALALLVSLGVLAAGLVWPALPTGVEDLLRTVDLNKALLKGMLGFLLFAGALHVDLGDLEKRAPAVAVLATGGVLISTALVGILAWLVLAHVVGLPVSFLHCLIFGALISPTDPIAVLSILKTLGAPRSLATKIAGESLFNDGVGIVLFLGLLAAAGLPGHGGVDATGLGLLFVQEALGGAGLGLAAGFLVYRLLRSIDDYHVELLLTLALVFGGYALAHALHVSGPIAMVVAGLLVGNHGRALGMSDLTRDRLDTFWELVDESLNAVLFVLLGLEVLVLELSGRTILAAALAIPLVLFSRFVAVGVPLTLLGRRRRFTPHAVTVLTWGGLRGGISVALVLWFGGLLPDAQAATRDVLIAMTYAVAAFSILVQGLTLGPLLTRLGLRGDATASAAPLSPS